MADNNHTNPVTLSAGASILLIQYLAQIVAEAEEEATAEVQQQNNHDEASDDNDNAVVNEGTNVVDHPADDDVGEENSQ